MTHVDFHILATTQNTEWLAYVARLTRKAQQKGMSVLIAVDQENQLEAVSRALWALSPESFLAHEPITEPYFPIQITYNEDSGQHHQVLINLCADVPIFFSRFERVFEIVSQKPEGLPLSRKRYKFYKDRGYPLTQHDLRDRV